VSKGKTYSCLKCGHKFTAHAPNDMHPHSSLNKDELDDPVKMMIECQNCHEFFDMYWGRKKITFTIG